MDETNEEELSEELRQRRSVAPTPVASNEAKAAALKPQPNSAQIRKSIYKTFFWSIIAGLVIVVAASLLSQWYSEVSTMKKYILYKYITLISQVI